MAKSSSTRDAAEKTAARTGTQAQAGQSPAKPPLAKAERSRAAAGKPAPQANAAPRAAAKGQSPRQAPRTTAAAKPGGRPQTTDKPMPTAHAAVKPAPKGLVGTPVPAPAQGPAALAPDVPATHAGPPSERDVEKEAGPAKKPVEDKQHPYTRGRLSTTAALRHGAVHLVTGLAGGLLINKLFDKKPAEKKRQAPAKKAEIKEKDGTKKNVQTSSPPSPRQQQEPRIGQATAQPVKVKARGRTR